MHDSGSGRVSENCGHGSRSDRGSGLFCVFCACVGKGGKGRVGGVGLCTFIELVASWEPYK